MFRNLATSLFEHGRIETTLAKAKDLRRVSERLVTLAKEDSLHNRRQAYSFITRKDVVHKLFAEVGPKFKTRPGGYTRVTKTGNRSGDAAPMAVIELVEEEYKPKGKKSGSQKRKPRAKKPEAEKAVKPEEASASEQPQEVKAENEAAAESSEPKEESAPVEAKPTPEEDEAAGESEAKAATPEAGETEEKKE